MIDIDQVIAAERGALPDWLAAIVGLDFPDQLPGALGRQAAVFAKLGLLARYLVAELEELQRAYRTR